DGPVMLRFHRRRAVGLAGVDVDHRGARVARPPHLFRVFLWRVGDAGALLLVRDRARHGPGDDAGVGEGHAAAPRALTPRGAGTRPGRPRPPASSRRPTARDPRRVRAGGRSLPGRRSGPGTDPAPASDIRSTRPPGPP